MKQFLAVVLLALASQAWAQETLTIVVGDQEFSRDQPQDLLEAQALLTQETALLNAVIKDYLASNADAADKVLTLMGVVTEVKQKVEDNDPVPPVVVPPVLGKTNIFALGGFLGANPWPVLGGYSTSVGVSADLNLFSYLLIGADVGLNLNQTLSPELRIRAAWWLF